MERLVKMRREPEGTERGALTSAPPRHWVPAVTVTGSKRIRKGLQVAQGPRGEQGSLLSPGW